MRLVSYEFMAFLAVLVTLYYAVPGRFQWMLLLAFSYGFCAWGGGGAISLLYPLITTASTWLLANWMGSMTRKSKAWIKERSPGREEKKEHDRQVKKRQRRLLALGLFLNFGILAVFKYFHVLLEPVSAVLGISYYTFQSMGYLIDVYYRKHEPEKNLARFALFVSFFPQMTAGPISRFEQMRDRLYDARRFQMRNVKLGGLRMLWGYFKKLVVADRLGPAVAVIIRSPETYDGIYVLLGMAGYAIWMYADFAGAMDIALGTAQMLGIRLPENFDRPFFSKSQGEFWRRWHMTLMLWLREYVFFPVSTSRFSKKASALAARLWGKKAGERMPAYLATLTAWFAVGVWHGASWNFVAWGLANGIALLISQELTGWRRTFHARCSFARTRAYGLFQVIRTFFAFACLEMLEYYSFGTAFAMFGSLVTSSRISQLWDGRFETLGLKAADVWMLGAGVLLMFAASLLKGRGSVRERLEKQPVLAQYGAAFGLFVLVLVAGVYGRGYDASQFIYNQF